RASALVAGDRRRRRVADAAPPRVPRTAVHLEPLAKEDAMDKDVVRPPSRRGMLLRVGLALNAAAAVLIVTPLVRYFFGRSRHEPRSDHEWIVLGPVTEFPEGQTRLASYRNPFRERWDGATADIPCYVRRVGGEKFQVFAINCAHLGCPVRWFPQS